MSNENETRNAPAVIAPVAEVVEIVAFKGEIEAWMGDAPAAALRAAVEAVAGVSIATCAEGPEAGAIAVKAAADALRQAELRNIEDWRVKFKSPVNAIGKRIDERSRKLLEITASRLDELKKELSEYNALIKRLRLEEEAKRKARTNERLQFAMLNAVVVDATDAEQMSDEEWTSHIEGLIEKKNALLEEQRKRDAWLEAIQKQITARMAEAHRLGAELSQEDAEYLTAEEFEARRNGWAQAKGQRDAAQRDLDERQDYRNRAADAGFVLDDATITSWDDPGDREIGFMLWLGERSKEKAAADRLTERLAQVEELELAIPMKQIKELGDKEWGELLRSLAPVPVAPEAELVPPMSSVKEVVIEHDPSLTSGGPNPAAPPVPTLDQVAAVVAKPKFEPRLMVECPMGEIHPAILDNPNGVEYAEGKFCSLREFLWDVTNMENMEHRKGASFYANNEGVALGMSFWSDTYLFEGDWGIDDKHTIAWNCGAIEPSEDQLLKDANAKIAALEMQRGEVKTELSDIQARFLAFGKSLPTEELKSHLRPIYKSMVDLVGKL